MVQQTPRVVLRLCASYDVLPASDCAIPERCEQRQCSICGRGVHYDPSASIPALGAELICCDNGACWGRFVPGL